VIHALNVFLNTKIFAVRIIKLAIISFVFFFLLITAFSLFIPSRIRVSRATGVEASREKVITLISQPAHWAGWIPGGDSTRFIYENGRVAGLKMDSAGSRSLWILEAGDSTVRGAIDGAGARRIETGWEVREGSAAGGVTVQWWMDFRLRWYPWEKFSSLLFEKQYGTQMEAGLESLKQLAEDNN